MTYEEYRILAEKPLLSIEEAAELTGLGQHTIRAMIAEPKHRVTLKVGRKTKIKREKFIRALNELDEILDF